MMARIATAALVTLALGVAVGATVNAAGAAKSTAPLTMTGCLRADGSGFVLTNLKGDQTPRKRHWKTAYLVKTKQSDLVVHPSSGVNLKTQVGRQVTVVGVVDGSRMTARSVKRVSASCS
jgi:hypothetical protein